MNTVKPYVSLYGNLVNRTSKQSTESPPFLVIDPPGPDTPPIRTVSVHIAVRIGGGSLYHRNDFELSPVKHVARRARFVDILSAKQPLRNLSQSETWGI
jgi:hypothetical protein